MKEKIEVMKRREIRRKQLLDDLKGRRGYLRLEEEALDSTLWETHFRPVVNLRNEWMNK